jgi:chromosome segregation ATPase
MSRLTRMFGKTRSDDRSTGPDHESADGNDIALFEEAKSEVNQQWGYWSQDNDGDMQYLEALNEHEHSQASVSSSSDSDDDQSNHQTSLDMVDLREFEGGSPKKEKEKKKKVKKRSKSERFSDAASSTSEGLAISSEGDSTNEELKKAKKREKRREESSKSSKREKKRSDKKRRSKPEDWEFPPSVRKIGSDISDAPKSPTSRRSSVRDSRSRGDMRSSSRPTRAHSADPAVSERLSLPLKEGSSRRRSKRDSTVSSKESERKKRSSRSKRKGSINLDIGGLGTALLPPSVPSNEMQALDGEEYQRQEILRLHQMLSDALQKVATQSAEQIHDKEMLMKTNGELTRLRSDYEMAEREKNELRVKLDERDKNIRRYVGQIDTLTQSLEHQRASQAVVEADLEQSEADVDKLLIKIEDLERAVDDTGNVTDETLRAELKEAKMAMVDKNREVQSRKLRIQELEKEVEAQCIRISELEKELEETATVHKLQVGELEHEISGLQGKLKGERLEATSKLTSQEDKIATLERELTRFRGNSEFEEIAVVRRDLEEAEDELEAATQELDAAKNMLTKVKAEKEDLVERNNKMTQDTKAMEKRVSELSSKTTDLEQRVLKWTEQTYEWKNRAEAAEKKLSAQAEATSDIISDAGSTNEDTAPQGLFLQAIMDKKESKMRANRWKIFSRSEDDQTPEEIRIRGLEEQNQILQEKNAELQSEIVKFQSSHKDELYNKQKRIEDLARENEALKTRAEGLEKIAGETMSLE